MRLIFLAALGLQAQRSEYDFYREGRDKRPEAYAEELRKAGIPEKEIARRLDLLRNHRTELEADRWNRFYGDSASQYNREPNAFLAEVVHGMKPGVALDYAMGDGRNSLYLAKLGWTVYGFDISEVGVNAARQNASRLGLKIDAVTSSDANYNFGKDRFDLILFSWSMPLVDVRKVIDALKPSGVVVMEFGPGFTGRNGMLRLFDDLVIEHYELTRGVSDFSDRRETEIFRLIARKEPPNR
ncbi:MAG TPA: methyltransferase domain-containing protein [Bryobacteraceae bacterium]|nr:methyltransferase domain-containing protein [Bryobacteraceae bacterium]